MARTNRIDDASPERDRVAAAHALHEAPMSPLAVLRLAIACLDIDGPASAAAVLNTHGRNTLAKANQP